jgi:hypothetical protein
MTKDEWLLMRTGLLVVIAAAVLALLVLFWLPLSL